MQRALRIWLFLLSLILAPAVLAETFPQYTDVYVDDFASLLPDADKKALRDTLISLYDQTGIEAVVVTLPSLAQYKAKSTMEAYATALFNTWGVGNAKLNNGVMVLIFRDDRKMRIELGSSYGHALDAEMKRIIDVKMLPEFRQSLYPKGIRAGVEELVRVMEVRAGVLAPPGLIDRTQTFLQEASGWVLGTLGAIVAAIMGALSWLYQMYRRSRPRFCPIDGTRMDLLSEDADDAKLQPGQTIEERVGSVDYDVWSCPKCQHVTIESYRRWFSSYGACRSCHYRTLHGTTTVLQAATTSHSGLKRIDYHCANCSASYSETATIPKLSSSSGSSRSSFGGGSSSGGGASGGW